MKALRHRLNPKNIRDAVMRRGSHHGSHDGSRQHSEARSDAESEDGSRGAATPSTPSLGAPPSGFSGGGSGTVPPPGLPPGAKVMSGPPPPGAHIVKMPPGSRPLSPSGTTVRAGSPPLGAKIMSGPPPPGAKIMSGPPPAGAKMMSGPPPPGVKVMSGPPPAGVKIMNGPPPGAKIISGPPPPGARLVPSPSLSRPSSPEVRPGSRSPEMQRPPAGLPPGVKILSGPPPPGARIMKSPPAGGRPGVSVSPPSAPPMKLMIKSGSRSPSPGQSAPSTPQLNSLSFSKSPPPPGALVPPASNVLKPTPTIPRPAAVPPAAAVSNKSNAGPLQIPRPSSLEQYDKNDESFEIQPESSDSNIDFVVDEQPVSPSAQPAPTKAEAPPAAAKRGAAKSSSSSTDSSMFEEEPDLETAPPAPRAAGSARSGMSKESSVRSSEAKAGLGTHGSSSQRGKKEHKTGDKSDGKVTNTKKHRTSKQSKSSASGSSSPAPQRDDSRPRTPSQRMSRDLSSMPSPAEVDRTKRRTPQASTSMPSSFADNASDAPLPAAPSSMQTAPLTPALRTKIADQFLSILCPQQYYGKVKRITAIRPINGDRTQAQGLKTNNSIYVATKGETPNSSFFPQLRLLPADAVNTSSSSGTVSTPVILYEAAPGRMLFADTELEGRRLLGTTASANSCFILASSSILFRDPAQYVLPVATLSVEWTPFASSSAEPQCPIHKRELQLFDPFTKELVCALCASKQGETASRLVVIPDVLSGDSRNRIQASLTKQLDEAQRSAKLFVGQHQRIALMQENKKRAVSQQFDMLIAAIESKRQEYLEACDAEFGFALSDVAAEILVSDEKVQLLSAATDHLRSDSTTKPIYSMQIATIAEAVAANRTFPVPFAKGSLKVPAVSSGVMPNLEGVMAELQALNPSIYTGHPATFSTQKNRSSAAGASARRRAATSPRQTASALRVSGSPVRTRVGGVGDASDRSTPSPRQASRWPSAGRRVPSPSNGLVRSPRRAPPSPPKRLGQDTSASPNGRHHSAGDDGDDGDLYSGADDFALDTCRGGVVSVPNSSGTSLFDFPLHELIAIEEAEDGCRPRCVQWAFRVEDPGDWVGIGVGVGSTIDAWERSARNDLSHLWIVPYGGRRQTFLLRVTVHTAAGHAKLTIHDAKGRQLDDGAIPQWNAARISYPQVTFGGRVGRVRLIEAPALV